MLLQLLLGKVIGRLLLLALMAFLPLPPHLPPSELPSLQLQPVSVSGTRLLPMQSLRDVGLPHLSAAHEQHADPQAPAQLMWC